MVALKEILFRKANATVTSVFTFITFQLLQFTNICQSLRSESAMGIFCLCRINKKRFCSVPFCHSRLHYILSYTA